MPTRLLTLSNRLYEWLLVLYPAPFRAEFGEEMSLLFRDCCRDAHRERGTAGVIGILLSTLGDLVRTAAKEQIAALFKKETLMDVTTFDRQLGNTLSAFAVLLRSGYSVLQSFEHIAEKSPEPTASAFRAFVEDVKSGKAYDEALTRLAERIPSQHLQTLLDMMKRQRVEGGNLAHMIEPLSEDIRKAEGQDDKTAEMLRYFREMTSADQNQN